MSTSIPPHNNAAGGANQKRNYDRTSYILVVDDDNTLLKFFKIHLNKFFSRVIVVKNAKEAIDTLREKEIDLVLSDIRMPRMDGIQLVRHIKEDARLKKIPVVVVSYKDREEDRIRGLDAGADAYLTKSSFHDRTFLSTVADLIGGARE